MKKGRKAALYDPYLDTLGGGEKHILSILKVLEENGYDLTVFWPDNVQDDIKNRLNLSFDYLINFEPNIFYKKGLFKKMYYLQDFDYFFYVTDGSYFFSSAKNNIVFCMVPNKALYNFSFLNKMKISNYRFITNSKFTQKWLGKWGVRSDVVYPHVDPKLVTAVIDLEKKEKMILSVGRFFKHLHSKKQEVLIDWFKKLQENPKFKDYKLVLAGGVKNEDKPYFESLKKKVGNDTSVALKPNISFDELFELYKKAEFFWHLAGQGVDEEKNPELVEHLGITPLEAMAMGAITFCYNAGGPREYIRAGKNGFLFQSQKDLFDKMAKIQNDDKRKVEIARGARETVRRDFSMDALRNNVARFILKTE